MLIESQKLKKYLSSIKQILQQAQINPPPCFISYAWESDTEDNKKLQTWLSRLKEDLDLVGIKTFLDIYNMHGHMRSCMESNISQGGFVLLIGTPKFKERAEQDRLYKIPRNIFDLMWPPSTATDTTPKIDKKDIKGKAIVLIDNDGNIEDNVYFIEEGKILHKERTLGKKLNIEGISWSKMSRSICIADISRKVNGIIDQAKQEAEFTTQKRSKTFGSSITNVAFEFGFTLEKGKGDASALIPLLYKGDFGSSFPANILKENLIRDIRQEEDYAHVLVGLSNPMGIIPAICPQLIDNPDYRELITSLLSSSELSSEEDLSKKEQPKKVKRTTFEDSPQSSPSRMINDEGEATIKLTISATDFHKEDKIGEGGYGVVYKGEWENIPVAIKALRTGKMPDKILAEFKNEAFIMAQYRHPNIVQLYGICLEQPYSMIMEFLVNGSLFYWLHSSKRLEWPKKYKIAKDVAVGLAFLHKQSIIHRDIKSLNVLLDQQLNAKLSDYGLAKIKTYSGNTMAVVGKKHNVGTTVWKAPELFKRGSSCSNASDVYSYGMLLWEIASHKIPFEDAESPEIAQGWIKDGEQEVIPPNCPTSFAEIIKLCWNQLPEARPGIATIVQKLTQLVKEPVILLPEEDELSKFIEQHHSKLPSSVGHSATKTHDSIDNSELMPVESSLKPTPDALDKLTEEFPHQVNLRSDPEPIPEATPSTFANLINDCRDKDPLKHPTTSVIINSLRDPQLPKNKPMTPKLLSPRTQGQIAQFFNHVGYGEQDEAEVMLKTNPRLAILKSDLIDCSGRIFKNITSFQYAVWALDWHMWSMIKKYLLEEEIRSQIAELEHKAWIEEHGNTVSWQNLIDALHMYFIHDKNILGYSQTSQIKGKIWNWEKMKSYWCEHVGQAQLTLPAHVIQEYSKEGDVDGNFTVLLRSRNCTVNGDLSCNDYGDYEIGHKIDNTVNDWFKHDQYTLGKDFAWVSTNGWHGYDRIAEKGDWDYLIWGDGVLIAGAEEKRWAKLFSIRLKQKDQLISQYTLHSTVAKTKQLRLL